MVRRTMLIGVLGAALLAASSAWPVTQGAAAASLPNRLSDAEFWRLSVSLSEDGGEFHSENFVSNEGQFQTVIPELTSRVDPGGVYLGVGPEQNFTYIAAIRPAMAFIVDLRRGNLHEHLLYKALFGLSSDRAEFVARLFSRATPTQMARNASPESLFTAIAATPATEARYRDNIAAIRRWLTDERSLPLTPEDLDGVEYVYRSAFFTDGPDLNYRLNGRGGFGGGGTPTYAQLMTIDDGAGQQRSFLATEELFRVVKDLQARNLVVPVVGDFAGTKALRGIGRYVRDHQGVVTTFYLSNVEQYGRPVGQWGEFCGNVAEMPLDGSSTFIRSFRGGRGGSGGGRLDAWFVRFTSSLGGMLAETRDCRVAVSGGQSRP